MKEKLLFFSVKHPLLLILLLAIVLRLLAVVFTGGNYLFNYYHIPESWLATPWIVYSSRLLFGAFSLLIITLSYRITKIIADKTTALEIALLLSCYWAAPYLSVHTVPSVLSMPFLLYGTLLIVKQNNLLSSNEIEKFHRTTFLIAGFCLGLGFAVNHVSFIYYIGILIALFILKNWKGAVMTLIGYITAVVVTQSVIDLIIYHRPFVEMTALISHIGDYFSVNKDIMIANVLFTGAILLVLFIIPLSLMLLFGFCRSCRKYLLMFLPAALSIVYSLFAYLNNIDFVLTIIPIYLIVGYVGWKEFYKNSAFWSRNKWLVLACYILFALINTVLLVGSYFYF